jgi:hypothetical protein
MLNYPDKRIDLRFFLLFIPVAYGSYLFHEFGHWTVGEILGNQMAYSLNGAWPKSGHYLHATDDLYASVGGPAFSILQSIYALLIIEKHRTLYAYPVAFFPMFSRFFSLVLGGFAKQDEARISALLGIGTYVVAIVVLVTLVSILMRCSYNLRIGLRNNMYLLAVSTACQLVVIGTYEFIQL